MKFKYYVLPVIIGSIFLISGCSQMNDQIDNIDTNQEKNIVEVANSPKITEEEAINLVKKYLSDNGYHRASHIEVDGVDRDIYLIHVYDVITNEDESHIATTSWFEVNMNTGEIKDVMKQ
ncbi:MAG: hypothetical protein ACRCXT_09415 [Paraclostridium sp.]